MDRGRATLFSYRMRLGEFLRLAMEYRGRKPRIVADYMGVTVQAVYQWRMGKTTPEPPKLQKLLDYLGVPNVKLSTVEDDGKERIEVVGPGIERLLAARPRETPSDKSIATRHYAPRAGVQIRPEVPPPTSSLPRDIPLMGVAVGGKEGDFSMNGAVADYVRRPYGLLNATGIFAIEVVSDSMAPKYEPRDMVFASEARSPAPGDYVIVELHPTVEGDPCPAFLKRLKTRTGQNLVCEQFNPEREVTFPLKRVRAVYRVVPNRELYE